MRPRLSQGKRALLTEYLDRTFAHKCFYCEKNQQLEIHRKDPSQDYTLANCLWACKQCNLSQRVFGKDTSDQVCVSVPNSDGDEDALDKNKRTEPAWVEFVTNQLNLAEPLRKDLLTGNSALFVGISVATVNRHWKKYACPLGPFQIYRPNQGTALLVRLRKRPGT